MKRIEFKHPEFVKSAFSLKQCPRLIDRKGDLLPEIAVVGRSNVGKSTLLNHLFQTKGLVKTSSKPGKTQSLNFFTLNNQLVFVDLPGYGFSKVSIEESKREGVMIENYLNEREPLRLLLLLVDIRRSLCDKDLQMLKWIQFRHLPAVVVLTKTDKVNQSLYLNNTQVIISGLKQFPYVHYSAMQNKGRNQLIAQILKILYDPS